MGIRTNVKIPFFDVENMEPLMQRAKAGARVVLPRHWYLLRLVATVEFRGEEVDPTGTGTRTIRTIRTIRTSQNLAVM